VFSDTATKTYGSSPRGCAIAGNDKVILRSRQAVCEFDRDRPVVFFLLHRGDLLAKNIFDLFIVLSQVEEDLCEVAAKDLLLRYERLLIGISSGFHGCKRCAVVADEADTLQLSRLGPQGGLHPRHLPHYSDADATDVDVLSTGAQHWKALDDGDICSGFGKPVGRRRACDGRTYDENVQSRHCRRSKGVVEQKTLLAR